MDNHFQHFISANGEQIELLLFVGVFFISWNMENLAG